MKKIPTGIKSFRKLREENYYFVDKTLMIKDFLERGSEVTLVTRPRRFGKTINMSMMSEFFDITGGFAFRLQRDCRKSLLFGIQRTRMLLMERP